MTSTTIYEQKLKEFFLNEDHFNSYIKIIDEAKSRPKTRKAAVNILGYVERHHILPRCLNGDDSSENLVFLTAKEHFIAHYLLGVGTENAQLLNAAWQMANKNKLKFAAIEEMSQEYENLRSTFSKRHSENMRNLVFAKNIKTGKRERVSPEIFHSSEDLVGNTMGLVTCRNEDGKVLSVTIEEFKARDDLVGVSKGYAPYIDSGGNTVILHESEDKTNCTSFLAEKVICKLKSNGEFIRVSRDEFHSQNHLYEAAMANKTNVIDLRSGKTSRIDKAEFDSSYHVSANRAYEINGEYYIKFVFNMIDKEGNRRTFYSLKQAADFYGVTRRRLENNMRRNFSANAMLVSRQEMVPISNLFKTQPPLSA